MHHAPDTSGDANAMKPRNGIRAKRRAPNLLQPLYVLKSTGALPYTAACFVLVLWIAVPVAMYTPAVTLATEQWLILWLVVGLAAPVFETLVFQEWIQEALLRQGVNQRVRIAVSWAAFTLLHSSGFSKLLLGGGVQGFLYAVTYAVWRPAGRKQAFVMVLCLHLLVSNALLALGLLFGRVAG